MKIYIKFFTLIFLKSLLYVVSIMFSLIFILNLLTELEFFKEIEVSSGFPLFLSLLNSPSMIFEMLPFIFLITTQLFFIKLFNNNEIEIFKYSGLKNTSILKIFSLIVISSGIILTIIFYNFSAVFKNFYLDNSVPSAKTNILQLNHECLSKEELYLWAWSEVFLRFKRLSKSNRVLKSIVFKTEDLKSPKRVETLFKSLNIKYNAIKDVKIINTNQEIGLRKTKVLEEDLEKLVKFIKKLPKDKIELKKHLKSSLQKNNLILKKFNI